MKLAFIFLFSVVTFGYYGRSIGQTVNMDNRNIQLQEGKMFTVQLRPLGKQIEIRVVGRKLADIEMTKLGIEGELKLPGRTVKFSPKLKEGKYLLPISDSEKASSLNLNIKLNETSERFEFKLPLPR